MLLGSYRARRIMLAIAAAVIALVLLSTALFAQQPTAPQQKPFIVFADTAGITPIPGTTDTYATYVYALATPTSWPSSAILVAWDCKAGKVKRLGHVVYRMKADSTGVEGPWVEDDGAWVDPVDPRLYKLVCTIGPTHVPQDDDASPSTPNRSPWFAPGKPRTEV